jgi:hypothetical protein
MWWKRRLSNLRRQWGTLSVKNCDPLGATRTNPASSDCHKPSDAAALTAAGSTRMFSSFHALSVEDGCLEARAVEIEDDVADAGA